jgi:hypothetical protein
MASAMFLRLLLQRVRALGGPLRMPGLKIANIAPTSSTAEIQKYHRIGRNNLRRFACPIAM